jgi:hypothetical protein
LSSEFVTPVKRSGGRTKYKGKNKELQQVLEVASKVAGEMLIKNEEDFEKITKDSGKHGHMYVTNPKRLTRGLVRRMRNNNKDAEEGKYFEKELSSPERSYSPTTVEESESGSPTKKVYDLINSPI